MLTRVRAATDRFLSVAWRARAGTRVLLCLLAMPVFAQTATLRSQAERDMSAGRYARAETGLLEALSTDPENESLWFLLGITRAQLKKTDPAIEAFEKALPLASDPAPVYFNLGLLQMEKNDLAKAEDTYRRGLALDPSNIPANQNYALLLMQRGEFRDAAISLERLKKLTPADVSVRASLIEAYVKAASKAQARSEIDELIQSRLATLPQGLSLARVLRAEGETDAARHVLESLRNYWPASAELHGELGLLLIDQDQFREAAEELKQALQLDRDSVKYSLGFGEALISSQQYPAALQFLFEANRKFVNQPNIQYQLAFTDVCLQRFPEAISILKELGRERPDSGKVQFLLGGAYELEGELQGAEDHYRNAIRLSPQDPTNYRVLGSMLQKLGREHLDESIQLLRKALSLDPANVETKIVLARSLERQESLDEAAALLEQAITTDPASRRAHTALAELYLRQKRPGRAEQEQSIAATLEDQKMREWEIWGRQTGSGP